MKVTLPKFVAVFWWLLPLAVFIFLLPRSNHDSTAQKLKVPRVIQFALLDGNGAPAIGAGAVLLKPEVAGVSIDERGIATAHIVANGPLQFVAWMDGHQVLEIGPVMPDGAKPFSFVQSPPLPDAMPALIASAPREFSFACKPEQDLQGALLLARLEAFPDAAPWVATLDDNGACILGGVPEGKIIFELFSPGMPPIPICALGRFSTSKMQQYFQLDTTQVILQGHPADSIFALTHLGNPNETSLPQFQIPESGTLTLPPLPRNQRYRITGPDFKDEFETTAGVYRIRCKVPANK